MASDSFYVADLRERAKSPGDRIFKVTLQDDERTRVVLFGFSAGQELAPHTAPFPATLTFLKGNALLKLGPAEQEAAEGSFAYMPARLEHGIKARSHVVMLLTIIKDAPQAAGQRATRS